ncbi:MAG: hypothetical protein MZU91_05070 [Desulfosudis oleivorans]|nr:hypothetical protein [Desulfosudis oleivorans]
MPSPMSRSGAIGTGRTGERDLTRPRKRTGLVGGHLAGRYGDDAQESSHTVRRKRHSRQYIVAHGLRRCGRRSRRRSEPQGRQLLPDRVRFGT